MIAIKWLIISNFLTAFVCFIYAKLTQKKTVINFDDYADKEEIERIIKNAMKGRDDDDA